jgi:hypothetical protein
VPAMCTSDTIQEVKEIIRIMDEDGTIAGLRIIWVTPLESRIHQDIVALIEGEKTGLHIVYPHVFHETGKEPESSEISSLSATDKLLFFISNQE